MFCVLIVAHYTKYCWSIFLKSKSNLKDSLKVFGEVGVVTIKNVLKGKLKNLGITCIFLGCSVDQADVKEKLISSTFEEEINRLIDV
jgi:hypothetical protein